MPDLPYHPVSFDVDGVVGDIFGHFARVAEAEFGITGLDFDSVRNYTELDKELGLPRQTIYQIVQTMLFGDWALKIKPYPGATDLLARWGRAHRLLFVTARPEGSPVEAWLRGLLKNLPPERIEIVLVSDPDHKANLLVEKGVQAFVEDRLDTCLMIASKTNVRPIIFDQPWNRHWHPFEVVRSWAEIETLVTELMRQKRSAVPSRPE
jgi:uncharacterized HAD superfamily protein